MQAPAIDQQPPPAEVQPAPKHTINVTNQGQIYLDGKPVTMDELAAALTARKATDDKTNRGQDKK
jgi:biopolymer transport protein ExbD